MKIRALLASVLGLSAFAVLGYGQAAAPSPTPTPPPNIPATNNAIGGPTGGAPGTTPHAHANHGNQHPAIRAAIKNLQRAVFDLQNAAHDFGGHRDDAINACNAAIAQLQLALQYAGAHSGSGGSTPTPTPAP